MITRRSVLIATFWVTVIFGMSQVIRLGSNLILTRLLEPEMFGLMAIAYVLLHGLVMFSDLGLWAYLVRHKDGNNSHLLNVIWSIQVLRGWGMFVVLATAVVIFVIVKDIIGVQFNGVYDQDVFPLVIIIISLTAVITGYESMASTVYSRELKRGKLESIELFSQIIAVAVMLTWAYISPSIWALVAGGVTAPISKVMLTYRLFPIRHQFTWDKKIVKDAFDFGKWIVLASILTFIAEQGDRLFFSAKISATMLGVYSIAFMIYLAIASIAQQITFKIWFPVLSKTVNENKLLLKEMYYKVRLRQDVFIFTLAGILAASSNLLISFLYDPRYHDAGGMLQILTIALVGQGLSMVGLETLSALGVTRYRVKVMLARSFGTFVALPLCYYFFGFQGALYAVALNVFMGVPVIYWELHKNDLLCIANEFRVIPIFFLSYWATAQFTG